ncbi:MAG TPA: ABC transporter substrate-binding protein [Paralcaligenes sp.]
MQNLKGGFNAIKSATRKTLAAASAVLLLTAATAGAQAQTLTKVRYQETVRSLQFTTAYVAMARGYFKDAGLDLDMKTAQGTDKAMAALLSGSADIALLGPEAVIYVANSESPAKPKIISGLVATDGFLLVERNTDKSPQKFDWNDLKGKTVMAYRPGSTPDVYLGSLLRKHHLAVGTDLKIVNNIGPAARMGAWLTGKADYAIFLEPEASTIERQGKGKIVTSIGNEVGLVDYTVFAAMPDYIASHPKVIKGWVTAIARAMKDVATDQPAVIAKDLVSYFPGLSQAELVQSIERYRKYGVWKKTPQVAESAINTLQDMLIASKTLKGTEHVPYARVVAPELAEYAK